jgi:hypothetical protein
MVIRNMLAQIGYGSESDITKAREAQKSYEKGQSPSTDPLDSVDISGEILRGQGRREASGDSTKARMDELRHAFRKLEAGASRLGPACPAPVGITQNAPLTDQEKVMKATETRQDDPMALKTLKADYRVAYLGAGRELESAQKAAAQGSRMLEDGSRQEVMTLENGNTQVTTVGKDGSRKSVQFNPRYPERVLINKKGPSRNDESGKEVPGEEFQLLRNGATVTFGPGDYGSFRGKGRTVTYRIDNNANNPERIEYSNNDGKAPFSATWSRINGKGDFETKQFPLESTKEEIEAAEKGDEFSWIRSHIHQNVTYRDPQGRKIDGTGQTVAVLEADVDEFSGQLGSHAGMVRDTMNSKEAGVAPGAAAKAFEVRPDDYSYLLPGFSSKKRPPDKMEIPDNKEALIAELDKTMRFDKRIVPELDKILDVQKKGAGISALNMSFGESPLWHMDQVMSLLNVSKPGTSDQYAYPELRKAILGGSAGSLPTKEALEKDPSGIYRELNEKKPDGTYANPELRKALFGDNEKNHPSLEAMEKKGEDLHTQVNSKDDKGHYSDADLRKKVLGDDADKLTEGEQKNRIQEYMLHGYRKERFSDEMKKVADFVNECMNDPKGGFQQALGEYQKAVARLAEAGITPVVVAGNEQQAGPTASSSLEGGLPSWDSVSPGSSLVYQGRSPHVITVAATDSQGTPGDYADDRIGEFSSHGYGAGGWNPTVAAPGVNQKTAVKRNVTTGTSFSAPYLAGVIALMKQADPSLKTDEIIEILKKTAVGIASGDTAGGAGEVAPEAAVREVLRRAGRLPKAA